MLSILEMVQKNTQLIEIKYPPGGCLIIIEQVGIGSFIEVREEQECREKKRFEPSEEYLLSDKEMITLLVLMTQADEGNQRAECTRKKLVEAVSDIAPP
jgi:hypothetical protein